MKNVPIFYDIMVLLGWSRDLRNSISISRKPFDHPPTLSWKVVTDLDLNTLTFGLLF